MERSSSIRRRIPEAAKVITAAAALGLSPGEPAAAGPRSDSIPEHNQEEYSSPERASRFETENGPVITWIPENYDPETANTVVYVHGYYEHVDQTLEQHDLLNQFRDAEMNSLVVIPEAPAGNNEPVYWQSLDELKNRTFTSLPDTEVPKGDTIVVAHSGGFRSLESWLAQPNEQSPDTIVLLDAMYSVTLQQQLQSWLLSNPEHALIMTAEYSQHCTGPQSEAFAQQVGAYISESIPTGDFAFDWSVIGGQALYMKSQFKHHDMPSNVSPVLRIAQSRPQSK